MRVQRSSALLWGVLLALAVPACAGHEGGEHPPACAGSGAPSPPALPPADRSVMVAGEAFEILSAGPASAETVLLLQGFPDGSYDHRAALPRLANAGYRALAPVRRAASSPAAEADSLRARAEQVLLVADALELERFHVAGGQLAWDVARLAPRRVISVAHTPPAQIAAITALERAAPACAEAR